MERHFKTYSRFYATGSVVITVVLVLFFAIPLLFSFSYSSSQGPAKVIQKVKQEIGISNHVKTPKQVKALYMTSCAASTQSFRDHILSLLDETELNSLMIDIKDFTGTIAFTRSDPKLEAQVGGDGCRVPDMKEFVEELHKRGVYVIGRVTVFQDPYLAQEVRPEWAVKRASDGGVWEDRKGLSFIDVGAREYWDFVVELSKESYNLGFDEINFDYIRYPSDGNLVDIAFIHSGDRAKEDVLEDFFIYLHDNLKDTGLVTSADLFGMTTTALDDMNIGQVFERALPYFDYIAPMVYPSHYPPHFNGWADPDDYPYETLHFVLSSAVLRAGAATTTIPLRSEPISTSTPYVYAKKSYPPTKIRPWIQDFDYGGDYGPEEVRAQIQAVYDVGMDSWMLWDPGNKYTRGALLDK